MPVIGGEDPEHLFSARLVFAVNEDLPSVSSREETYVFLIYYLYWHLHDDLEMPMVVGSGVETE